MSNLNQFEKLKLEKLFDMGGGYVLDFTNYTFSAFVSESIKIEVYDDKYSERGESKANRLRVIWAKESNYLCGKLILDLIQYRKIQKTENMYSGISDASETLIQECEKIGQKLKQDTLIEEIEAIRENHDERDMALLARTIKESVDKNQPEAALDRLHTYVLKYIRGL